MGYPPFKDEGGDSTEKFRERRGRNRIEKSDRGKFVPFGQCCMSQEAKGRPYFIFIFIFKNLLESEQGRSRARGRSRLPPSPIQSGAGSHEPEITT